MAARLGRAVARAAALVVLSAVCPAVAAAEEMVFDPAPTESCLAAEPSGLASCVGHAADACMLENEMGETTIGMGFCLSQEWEWWDARLNAAYAALMTAHEAADAAMKAEGLEAPSVAEALRAMQRAWIGYRDAACDYERAQWGGGTGGGPATAGCLMRLTGEQALALEGRLMMLERQ
jgi:uncharacterized protein YecT (DUF1311 family)